MITTTLSNTANLSLLYDSLYFDFTGKKVFFKAMVSGEPAPTVTWGRNKGEVDDPEKYKTRYDERSQEYILEVRKQHLNKIKSTICKTKTNVY